MKTKRSIYNLLFNIISQLVTLVIGIILPRLFIVNLGSEVNGLVSSVGQVYAYVSLLEAGLSSTAIQALYNPIAKNDRKRINEILGVSDKYYKKIGLYYMICVCLLTVFYPVIVHSTVPTWQVAGVVFFSGIAGAVNFWLQQKFIILLTAEGKTYVVTNINLFVNTLSSLIKAVLLLLGYNIVMVVGAQFVVTLLRIAILKIYMYKNYKWTDYTTTTTEDVLSKRKYVMIQQIAYFVYCNTDVLVLTFFCGLKVVSVYTMYNLLIGAVEGIVAAFSTSVVFALGLLFNEDRIRFNKMFKLYDAAYMLIVYSAFTTVYIFILPFLRLYTAGVTDANYLDLKLAFIFVILKLVTTLRSQSQNTISFAGAFKETQRSALIEATLNLVVSLISVNIWGIYGVLVGSIVSTLYRGISSTYYVDKHVFKYSRVEMSKKYVRWGVYMIIFLFIAYFSEKFTLHFNNYFEIIIPALIVAITSIIIYFIPVLVNEKDVVKYAFEIAKEYLKRNKTEG